VSFGVHVSIRSVYIVVDRGEQVCPLLSLSPPSLSSPEAARRSDFYAVVLRVCVCVRARALLSQLQGRAAAESGIWIKAYESGPLRSLRVRRIGGIASLWIRLEPLGDSDKRSLETLGVQSTQKDAFEWITGAQSNG
jgi:hypothetical protein